MDKAKADAICALIEGGESLSGACLEIGVTRPTFLRWAKESDELADLYARARETCIDVRFEALQGTKALQPERGDKGNIDPGWVAWQRLQVDTEKWALSKLAPRKYGDKIETTHTGSITVVREMTDDELAAIAASGGK